MKGIYSVLDRAALFDQRGLHAYVDFHLQDQGQMERQSLDRW